MSSTQENLLTIHESREPAVGNPHDRSEDDASEIRALCYTVCVVGFIKQDTSNDLHRGQLRFLARNNMDRTWCMPKNKAMESIIPVYHGRIVRVVNMRKKEIVGSVNIAIFVLR